MATDAPSYSRHAGARRDQAQFLARARAIDTRGLSAAQRLSYDIFVSDRRLAEGEVVVVGEHFGVRITRVLSLPRDPAPRTGGR
mgnify:CR=1 FL=1